MTEPWEHPMYYACPHDYNPEVRAGMQIPEKVEICDLTLDENGEGMVGAYLTRDEKIHLAKMLDDIGIHRIGILGFPAPVSQEEVEIAKEISSLGLRAKLQALVSTKEDIDRALECNVGEVVIRKPVSKLYIHPVDDPKEKKIKDFVALGKYAKENGLRVGHMAQDITRADIETAREIILAIHEQVGLDELCFTDSQGIATPFGTKYLVEQVRSWIDVPIQVHCHNHIGFGLANSCAAVCAGAKVIHTTVCGIGHYAGMAPLEEVVVALKIGFGVDLDIKYERLYELAQFVLASTNVQMQPHKAVVGDQAFVKSEEIKDINALATVTKAGRQKAWFPFLPEFVGNHSKIIMAEKVTREAVVYNLTEFGIEATDKEIEEVLNRVKEITIKQRRVILEYEFKKIVNDVVN